MRTGDTDGRSSAGPDKEKEEVEEGAPPPPARTMCADCCRSQSARTTRGRVPENEGVEAQDYQ